MSRFLLTHARTVFAHEVRDDVAILIDNGVIAAIDPASVGDTHAVNLKGRTLIPGMVDLHCDALEKEVEPRPGVHFPLAFACAQADKRNASAGITTVFHALSFANHELGVRNNAFAAEIARAVQNWRAHALVDNRVHARYEVTDETAPPLLTKLLENGHADLLSFMDHSPGQGQFQDVAAYRAFLSRSYKTTDAELDTVLAEKQTAASGAMGRMQQLASVAHERGVAIASHDDDSAEKVAMLASLGAVISEFPTHLAAAKAARARGMATLFGAPNILRGRSQSGNMRALDAVLEGVADCLCGDYSAAALLPSVMKLPELADISLAQAIALVTRNPARAVGLHDRGEIAVGRRADLVAVRQTGGLFQAERIWVAGVAVLTSNVDVA